MIKSVHRAVATLIAAALYGSIGMCSALAEEAQIDSTRQAELAHLLKHDCGSCHGMTLQGGLGPALLPDSLVIKDISILKQIILQGRPTLGMPGWKSILSEQDAAWLASALVNGIGSKLQSK